MIEQGTIVEVKEGTAVVRLARREQCEYCHCCVAFGDGAMHLEADAPDEVAVGEKVSVEIPIQRLRAVFLVFVLPLAAVLVGALGGSLLAGALFPEGRYANVLPIAGALALVALTFVAVARYERGAGARRMRPRIVTVDRGES